MRKLYNIFMAIIAAIRTLPGLKKAKKMEADELFYIKKTLINKVTHRFGEEVIKTSNAQVTVEGLNNSLQDQTVLYVANHQSNYDIPLLFKTVPQQIGFIAKIETKKIPIAGEWITQMNGVFMDRADKRQSLQAIKDGILKLKAGHSLVIFPEGTRSNCDNLNDFKGGSLSLAKNANVPIVPIAIDGSYKIQREKKANVRITFLNPIFLTKEDNLNDVAEDIKNNITMTIENNKRYIKK
jgi:1-acyl-sn-glycerol-3-phosphate acyltransferase